MSKKTKNKAILNFTKGFTGKFLSFVNILKSKVPKRWQPHLTKRNIIITFVVLFFLIQYFQVSKVTGGISSLSMKGSSLVDEVGRLTEVTNMLAEDLTETRSFLLMPTRQYGTDVDLDDVDVAVDGQNENDLQIALFKYVGHLAEQENLKKRLSDNYSYLGAVYSNKNLVSYLDSNGLVLSGITDVDGKYYLYINDSDGDDIVYFYLEQDTGVLYRKTINSLEEIKAENTTEFTSGISTFLNENLSDVLMAVNTISATQEYITDTFQNENILKLLEKESLHFIANPTSKEFDLYYDIRNVSEEIVAQVVFSKEDFSISLIDARDEGNIVLQATNLLTALPPFIEKLDTLPSAQKAVIDAQLQLKETFEDDGFKLLLSEAGITINKSPREDEYRYYYDITLESGSLLGSVVIEKSTGIVEVVDPNGTGTTNLLFFQEELKKKL